MNNKFAKELFFLVWIIISIYLVKNGISINNNLLLPLILGEVIILGGGMLAFSNFKGWIILDIGLAILSYPIYKILGYDLNIKSAVKYAFLFNLILLSIQLFFDDYLRNNRAKKRCKLPFSAKCVSFRQSYNYRYTPVYKYYIDGKVGMYFGNERSGVHPKLGDVITIFVNEKNNDEVYCPTSKAVLMLRYIIGTLLMAFSTGAWIVL